jgi:hypothetical protein
MPQIIFLGVLEGGKKAAYLFPGAVRVSGAANAGPVCLPSDGDCQIIELAPGQGMKLETTSGSGQVATFTFELESIGAANYPNAAAASAERKEISPAGGTLLPLSNAAELGAFHFDAGLGALVFEQPTAPDTTGATGTTGATATAGTTGASGASGTTAASAATNVAATTSELPQPRLVGIEPPH